MTYFHYKQCIISNFVNNAIHTNADPIAIRKPFEFNTLRGPGLCSQCINMGLNSALDLGG